MTPKNLFTGWALLLYGIFFLASAALHSAAFVGSNQIISYLTDGQFSRWALAPCVVISISVAVSVLYILWQAFEDTWNNNCLQSKFKCRDIMLQFIVVHYFPPVALLVASIMLPRFRSQASAKEARPLRASLRYGTLLLQVASVPILLYGTFYDASDVYGVDEITTATLYSVVSVTTSAAWAFFA
jgi:preprotein translocase subunit Sec61beta